MSFWLRRVAHAASVLVAVSLLTFALLELAPGDYLDRMRLDPGISAETLGNLRERYGLDQGFARRYVSWAGEVLHGTWGYSFAYGRPVAPLLWTRVWNTLLLSASAAAVAWASAVPAGILWALRRRRVGTALSGITSIAVAVPEIVLALGALVLAAHVPSLPIGGKESVAAASFGPLERVLDVGRHMLLPVAVLATPAFAVLARHVRSSVDAVLDEPYVLHARALGGSPRAVLWHAVLRTAANPLVALASLSVATLLSGSFIVEIVMGWPGLGPLLLEAIQARDVYVVIGGVLCSAVLVVAGRLAADLVSSWNDPRVASR